MAQFPAVDKASANGYADAVPDAGTAGPVMRRQASGHPSPDTAAAPATAQPAGSAIVTEEFVTKISAAAVWFRRAIGAAHAVTASDRRRRGLDA